MTAHRHLILFFSILAGFFLAFALLFSLTVSVPLVGEILTPTHPAFDIAKQNEDFRRATLAVSSLWFWVGVTAIGTFFAAEIWKWMRG